MAFGLDPCLLALSACRNNRWANWWFEEACLRVIDCDFVCVTGDLIRDARGLFLAEFVSGVCYVV